MAEVYKKVEADKIKANQKRSAHKRRLFTAAAAIPILAWIVSQGGSLGWSLLVGIAVSLSTLEYYAMVFPGQAAVQKWVAVGLGLATIGAFLFGGPVIGPVACCGLVVFSFLFFGVTGMIGLGPGGHVTNDWALQLLGYIYIPFLLGHSVWIRNADQGVIWISYLLSFVSIGDTAAYYVGNAFGRHRLAPKVSPGKTIEGAAGGLLASTIIGVLFKLFWLQGVSWGACIAMSVMLSLAAQLGDLVESSVKRSAGVKDSGAILPGHGGMLDRIDGLIFATPVLYYLQLLLVTKS